MTRFYSRRDAEERIERGWDRPREMLREGYLLYWKLIHDPMVDEGK